MDQDKMGSDVENELNLVKEELGLKELELKEEQNLKSSLEQVRKILKKIDEAMQIIRPTADINNIIVRINKIIDLLKKDEKRDLTIIKEDRELVKDLKIYSHSKNEIFGAQNFKVIDNKLDKKEALQKDNLDDIWEIINTIGEILNYLNRYIGENRIGNVKLQNAINEVGKYMNQLSGVIRKEQKILSQQK